MKDQHLLDEKASSSDVSTSPKEADPGHGLEPECRVSVRLRLVSNQRAYEPQPNADAALVYNP